MKTFQTVQTTVVATAAGMKVGEIRFEAAAFDGTAGVIAHVQGSAPDPYAVRRAKDGKSTYCNCPSWRFQKLPAVQRVCKHMVAVKKAARRAA